jgi:cytochrome c
MKKAALAAAVLLALAAAPVQASEELAKKSGCLNCHNVTGAKKAGASFKDLSAKHKGKADAEKMLVAKLKDGKGHPAQKASEADLQAIVKWILAM